MISQSLKNMINMEDKKATTGLHMDTDVNRPVLGLGQWSATFGIKRAI